MIFGLARRLRRFSDDPIAQLLQDTESNIDDMQGVVRRNPPAPTQVLAQGTVREAMPSGKLLLGLPCRAATPRAQDGIGVMLASARHDICFLFANSRDRHV